MITISQTSVITSLALHRLIICSGERFPLSRMHKISNQQIQISPIRLSPHPSCRCVRWLVHKLSCSSNDILPHSIPWNTSLARGRGAVGTDWMAGNCPMQDTHHVRNNGAHGDDTAVECGGSVSEVGSGGGCWFVGPRSP